MKDEDMHIENKRPDRKEKYKERSTFSETVVKCSLQRLLVGNDKLKTISVINNRVYECSRRTHAASIALNLLVRKLFHNIIDVKTVKIPEFWDQTFIRQLLLGVDSARKHLPEINDLFEEFPTLKPTVKRYCEDRNIYCFAATKMSTNIKNHLRLNFPSVLKKYLYKTYTKETAVEILYRACGWKFRNQCDLEIQEDHHYVNSEVKEIRYILDLKENEQLTDAWFKLNSSLPKILRFFVYANTNLRLMNLPIFNILPIARIKPHFITIDNIGMKGILKELGRLKNTNSSLDTELWDSFLNTKIVQGKNKSFTGTIDTDGLVVNVHFKIPKTTKEVEDNNTFDLSKSLEGKRVLGVDPGRTNILSIVEELANGEYKLYTLTRRRYYQESGINKAKEQSNKWNLKIRKELELLSKSSPKSCCLDDFKKYLVTLENVQEALWTEYFKKRWREQRFRLYGGKKRVMATFLNTLNIDSNTVMVYGSAKFSPGGKGEVSVPTSRAYKECSYRMKVYPICEFRSTKVYWKDYSVLDQVMKRDKTGKLIAVRGLLWCSSTKETNKFINRDLNAAINILNCAKLPQRPKMLDRKFAKGKLIQKVGKILKC